MTSVSSNTVRLRIVLPVALTRLYFDVLDVSSLPNMRHIEYLCSFEDDPDKAARHRPDILVSLNPKIKAKTGASPVPVQGLPPIKAARQIVASPKLLTDWPVLRPCHLEGLPYATHQRAGDSSFFVTTPTGEKMVVEPRKIFGSNDFFAAHEAAKQGIAFAVLPKFFVAEDIARGKLLPLCQGWPPQHRHIQVRIAPGCASPVHAKMMARMMHEKLLGIPGLSPRG